MRYAEDVLDALEADPRVHTATKYVSPTEVIRATRVVYKPWRRHLARFSRQLHVVLTHGKPNFAARRFIKMAKRAKEPFPIRKVQLSFFREGR